MGQFCRYEYVFCCVVTDMYGVRVWVSFVGVNKSFVVLCVTDMYGVRVWVSFVGVNTSFAVL